MHSLLKRQLAKIFPGIPHLPEPYSAFVQTVDRTYEEFDVDRKMVDHMLEMCSQELLEKNATMRLLQEQLRQRNLELEKTVHEIKQMQDSLIQSEKMASIGQLTAGIAHEINNPLAFVASNLNRFSEYFSEVAALLDAWHQTAAACPTVEEFATRKEMLTDRMTEADVDFMRTDFAMLMDHTKKGTERIRCIVDRMRVFSHMAGDLFSDLDINEALDETIAIVWNEIKYKASIVRAYDVSVPTVCCNPGELKQVFVNLFMNAAQAIDGSGTITIKTRNEDQQVLIEVSDTGSGIAKEHQNRIFDPFFTTKAVGKGTGLGLWICATIIARHGGSIAVHSTVQVGTSFLITLPKTQPKSINSNS